MAESAIMRAIMLACSRGAARLFRNNVGVFRTDDGRAVKTGLCNGSSDLIGWRSIEVTPDMVGRRVAVFAAIEVKDRGRPTAEQQRFIGAVLSAGGIAGVARSVAEAEALLDRPSSEMHRSSAE